MPTIYLPPVSTYTALQTATLSSADTQINFSSIPSEYKDLILVVKGTVSGATGLRLRLNNNSNSIYNQVVMRNNGSSPFSTSFSNENVFYPSDVGIGANVPFSYVCQIMDYSTANKNKQLLIRTNTNATIDESHSLRWASNVAVNEVNVFLSGGESYQPGSTFSLYGIEA